MEILNAKRFEEHRSATTEETASLYDIRARSPPTNSWLEPLKSRQLEKATPSLVMSFRTIG